MATLFRKRNIWYINYTVNGKRFKVSTGTLNKKLAQVKFDDLKVRLFKGEIGAKQSRTSGSNIPEFFRRFIEYAHNNYSNLHLQSDLSRIRIFQEFLARKGIKNIQSITPGIYEEFDSTVLKGRKSKTRKNYLALIKTMFNYAVEWDTIEFNPIAKIKPPKIVKTFHFYSENEIANLIDNAIEPLKSAIIIVVNTGLRRAELFNLRWRDVDIRAKSLRVWPYEGFVPKGKKPRSIPLNSPVLATLKMLKKSNENESAYVFRPFNSMYPLYERFRSLLKAQGFKGTLHDLRHTFASHLAMNGTPIPVIKELLGHSDISTTMIYAHLSPERFQAEVSKLNF